MNSSFCRTISRILIVMMIWSPFQFARAGVIGTDQVIAAGASAERAAVMAVVTRAEVASQLASLGIDRASAADRVAAMTDEEVRSLAGKLEAMPAGADGGWVVALIVIGALVWYFWYR